MRAGLLRERVFIEKRAEVTGGKYGKKIDEWERFSPPEPDTLFARIKPLRGGEEPVAGRSTGVGHFEIWLRYSSLTKDITDAHRVVDALSGKTYNVKHPSNPDERTRMIMLYCESGGPDG